MLLETLVPQKRDPNRRRGEHGVDVFALDEAAALPGVGLEEREVGRPHEQVRHDEDVHLGRVVERERVQHAVVETDLQRLDATDVLGHERPMRQHGPPGR